MYGREDSLRAELIREQDVRYFLWDRAWDWSEYFRSDEVVYPHEPYLVFDTPERRKASREAGVEVLRRNFWVGIAQRGPRYRIFDLLLVAPSNRRAPGHPWAHGLDAHVEEVWRYPASGPAETRVFAVHAAAAAEGGESGARTPGG